MTKSGAAPSGFHEATKWQGGDLTVGKRGQNATCARAREESHNGPAETSALPPPTGLIAIPVGKGCVLLLTRDEYTRGLRRGKWWRRRVAREQRATRYPRVPCQIGLR